MRRVFGVCLAAVVAAVGVHRAAAALPQGFITFFDAQQCPEGWEPVEDAQVQLCPFVLVSLGAAFAAVQLTSENSGTQRCCVPVVEWMREKVKRREREREEEGDNVCGNRRD